ncbi:class F sortase [Rhodococcus hoagii]|uniref:class F sortase n=1 Tax=Rhodococcus hoagii TaxID=43767 RepID=UPI0007CD687D|nr:class F sortase [Prescottella equi]MBM4535859.1 class F sortase [Prescottella equi]NKR81543.1 class F sortase [Prescottella equi]ORJ93473.1 class F sortase [Prescottella equi]ORL04301.1 class F sortase [Prescottella equi]ORL71628.1 class F sortase [Prescottella equi]
MSSTVNDKPTGRFRRSSGTGLSAVLAGALACGFLLASCAAPESAVPAQSGPAPTTSAAAPIVSGPENAVLRPDRLVVAAIGVDTELIDLGLEPDGTLEVPPGAFPAGWYSGSPVPGERGPAILAGHVDWGGEPGVFLRLHELVPGDTIDTIRSDGVTAVFRVTRVDRYAKAEFPTAAVYGNIDHPGLRLITCGGEFDTAARSYRDNTVVFADLVEERVQSAQ